MTRAQQITRRVIKSRKTATRQVPAIVKEWHEELSSQLYAALDYSGADWGLDVLAPNGDPRFAKGGGFIRKSNAEIERCEIILTAAVSVDFSAENLDEVVFSLQSLVDELAAFVEVVKNPPADADGEDE